MRSRNNTKRAKRREARKAARRELRLKRLKRPLIVRILTIALQVVLNLGVVTDILPNTGISLPFISYGGTSLILIMMEMGILLSISKHTVETETVPEGEIK